MQSLSAVPTFLASVVLLDDVPDARVLLARAVIAPSHSLSLSFSCAACCLKSTTTWVASLLQKVSPVCSRLRDVQRAWSSRFCTHAPSALPCLSSVWLALRPARRLHIHRRRSLDVDACAEAGLDHPTLYNHQCSHPYELIPPIQEWLSRTTHLLRFCSFR